MIKTEQKKKTREKRVQSKLSEAANANAHTRVPDLEAHNSIGVIVDHALGQETGAHGGRDLSRVERAFAVPHNKGCLAHVLGAKDDNLGFERG